MKRSEIPEVIEGSICPPIKHTSSNKDSSVFTAREVTANDILKVIELRVLGYSCRFIHRSDVLHAHVNCSSPWFDERQVFVLAVTRSNDTKSDVRILAIKVNPRDTRTDDLLIVCPVTIDRVNLNHYRWFVDFKTLVSYPPSKIGVCFDFNMPIV